MIDAILSLVAVVALLLGSPGPAPLALAAVGAGFGPRNGIPFLLGILLGLLVAIAVTASGLGGILLLYPTLTTALQIAGGFYILYLAVKIATASLPFEGGSITGVPSFTDGLILNVLNPKAYAAFLAIFSQFALPAENQILSFLSTAFVCMIVATAVDSLWLLAGGLIGPIFSRPIAARRVRILFALLMVVAVTWAISKTALQMQ